MKKFHLITGLPRSGTTLLSTILRQNPKFEASISGPLARFVRGVIQESTAQGGYGTECPPEKTKAILQGIFDNYYPDQTKEVAFNTNRGWPLLLHTVKDMYPQSKVLLCVRDVVEILDSFEVLLRKNPYIFSSMFSPEEGINVYSRAETMLNPGRTLGFAYNAMKQGITSEHRKDIMIIEYKNLASNPEGMLKSIYKFIDEPYYDHDFKNVEASYDEFDEEVKLPGLHTTRKEVRYLPRTSVIPPDLQQMVNNNFPSVWRA